MLWPRLTHEVFSGSPLNPPRRNGMRASAAKPFRPTAFRSQDRVDVVVETGPRNSRLMFARTQVAAPVAAVFNALSAYDSLQDFIPGLVENRCLERRRGGAKLLQVGSQDLALGLRFTAKCVLDVNEFPSGLPSQLCGVGGFPTPRPSPRDLYVDVETRDITFEMLEGDFDVFKGTWRMRDGTGAPPLASLAAGKPTAWTALSYSLLVRPPLWLPIGLLEGRIKQEVQANLVAVARYVETNQSVLLAADRLRSN